jgi:tyrosine-protein kinase
VEGRLYLRLLQRNWRRMLVAVAVCLAGAAWLYSVAQPTYQAAMTFAIQSSVKSADPSAVYQGQLLALSRTQTYRDLVAGSGLGARLAAHSGVEKHRIQTDLEASVADQSVLLHVKITDESPSIVDAISYALVREFPRYVVSIEPGPTSKVTTAVLAEAPQPAAQIGPSKIRYAALGLLAGVFLAILLAVSREMLNRRIRDVEDVRAVLGADAVVTDLRSPERREGPPQAAVPLSGVIASAAVHERPVVLVPLRPGLRAADGAIALARRLLNVNHRVVLVDADADGAYVSRLAESDPTLQVHLTEQSLTLPNAEQMIDLLPAVALAGIADGAARGPLPRTTVDADTWSAAVMKVTALARDTGALALVVTDGVLMRGRPRLLASESADAVLIVDPRRDTKSELAAASHVLQAFGSRLGAVVLIDVPRRRHG